LSRPTIFLLLALTAAAAVFFVALPDIDTSVASAFYVGQNRFSAQGTLGKIGRAIFYTVPFLVLAAFIIAWAAGRLGRPLRFVPSARETLFVALTMALGPGLLVNLTLKDHTHRPRPVQLEAFGGTREFRPFYKIDGACPKNCAFPSGEASASFWLVAPALLAPPPWRAPAVGAALLFGAATGLLRMAFGGHFLSDVVFAALIMLLLIGACWRGFFGWRRP
jgi:lipid A 4'-phosphatase